MIEKYIENLKKLSNPIISNGEELITWQSKVLNIVVRIYGDESIQVDQIKNVLFITNTTYKQNGRTWGGGNNSKNCQKQASEIVNGFISDLESFGLPQQRNFESSGNIKISVNQQQHQTIKLKIILDAIKDALTESQVKELEEILNKTNNPDIRKDELIQKLKSFGADVVTNVVASILTNPALFS